MLPRIYLHFKRSSLILIIISITTAFLINEELIVSDVTSDQLLLNARLNDKENIQKGSSIDDNFILFVKKILEQSYVFNKDDKNATQKYMFQKLNQTYPGSWTIVLIQPISKGKQPLPIKDFDLISYSLNGTWWLYARGTFNKYLPDYSYIFIRTSISYLSSAPSKAIYCNCPYNLTSDFMADIISQVQNTTSNNIPLQLNEIREKYEVSSPGEKYNYFLNIPYSTYYSHFNFYVYGKNHYENDIIPTIKNKYWLMTF